VLRDATTGDLKTTLNGMGKGESFDNRDGVDNTITTIDREASSSTSGVEAHYGVDGDVDILDFESLEHDLDQLFSVGLGYTGSLSEQDSLDLIGEYFQLVIEGMMQNLLIRFTASNDASLYGTSHTYNFISILDCFVADVCLIGFFLVTFHVTNHIAEDAFWSFFASKPGLHCS